MENSENKNNKGLIILIVVFSLMVLGLGAWIVYDKINEKDVNNGNNVENQGTNSKEDNIIENKDDEYEIVNVNLSLKEISYDNYVKEYIESRNNSEVGDKIDINEVIDNLNKKINSFILDEYDELKYELKIENSIPVLYTQLNEDEKLYKKKFTFDFIKNVNGLFAYEEIGAEDSFPVEFWAIDNDNNIYYINTMTKYCTNDCGINALKINR